MEGSELASFPGSPCVLMKVYSTAFLDCKRRKAWQGTHVTFQYLTVSHIPAIGYVPNITWYLTLTFIDSS